MKDDRAVYEYSNFSLKMRDLELPVTTDNFYKVAVYIYKDNNFVGFMRKGSFDMISLENMISGDEQLAKEAISNWIKSRKRMLDYIKNEILK